MKRKDAGGRERILYISSYLPKLSETFVYREIFALRALGRDVATASLHCPEAFDEPSLISLAEGTVVVYNGWGLLLRDAIKEGLFHPRNMFCTLWMAWNDAVRGVSGFSLFSRLKILGQAVVSLALAGRLRGMRIAHIHGHMAHAPTTIAMYTARQLGIGFSFTGHAADLFRDGQLLREKLERARFISCISYWHREYYKSVYRRSDEVLPVIRCGIDPAIFVPEAHASYSVTKILAAGRLVRKKGFDILLQSLAQLKERAVPFHCTLIGDGEERAALQSLCGSLHLEDQVEFMGSQSNAVICAAMKRSDLFVLPCRIASSGDRDGIPVVLMEAMAAELCVVSGDLPTIRELVINEETGIMVEPEQVEELCDKLTWLIQDTIRRQALARRGRAMVVEQYSSEGNARKLNLAFSAAMG
ncbi:MAG: colanic acid biosynthesis glycosyltransferase WcaL [Spartobacteria bacterium]|nr:colanic acid biosynthesis glycosyltransferase WcaL [Spartobacteria bacterium]